LDAILNCTCQFNARLKDPLGDETQVDHLFLQGGRQPLVTGDDDFTGLGEDIHSDKHKTI
jgi:hypothetical protein